MFDDGVLVEPDGTIPHVIELKDAPGYVVPIEFDACCDDPSNPYEVTLHVLVGITSGVVTQGFRVDARSSEITSARPWPLQSVSPYEHLGTIEIQKPTLERLALAHAAMPIAMPLIGEMGWHVEALLNLLPERRAPIRSNAERNLIRRFYAETLADPDLREKTEQRIYIHAKLVEHLPEQWQADGDSSRLRPLLEECDAELERAGGWSSFKLQPGSFTLPDGWLDS